MSKFDNHMRGFDNPSDIYKNYISQHTKDYERLKQELEECYTSKDYVEKKLEANCTDALKLFGYTLADFSNMIVIKGIENKVRALKLDKFAQKRLDTFMLYLRVSSKLNKKINSLKRGLEILEKRINVKQKDFLSIIGHFNNLIINEVIERGYTFNMCHNLGSIIVRRKKRTRKKIDWNASKKYRQKLIDEGKVPYDKKESPDGIKWFIYHNGDYNYVLFWRKGMIKHKHVFSLTFQKSEGGPVRHLHRYIREHPRRTIQYSRK